MTGYLATHPSTTVLDESAESTRTRASRGPGMGDRTAATLDPPDVCDVSAVEQFQRFLDAHPNR
ncbi:MAG: hypothetical protein ACRDRS_12310 [Pseudonocardiaceae bacterium]